MNNIKMKISFITLTNNGYLDYTRNCIKSLEKIGVEGLKVYCIDDECFNKLDYPNKFKIDNPKEEQISEFHKFRSGIEWTKIVFQKFKIIYKELKENDYVLFTDGDIVFKEKRIIEDLLNRIGDYDLLAQNDRFDDYNDEQLCTGFMLVRSCEKTINFFDPNIIKLEGIRGCDQIYVNFYKNKLKYKKLPLNKYPNGKYFRDNNNYNPYIIHYNFLVGHSKKEMMIKDKNWYIN